MSIATPYDIQRNSTIGKDVPIPLICAFLEATEEGIFNNSTCLGWDFYQSLIADLAVIPMPTAFAIGVIYNVGDYVQFEGEIYEVIATTTGQESPTNSIYFKLPNKFTTAANNEIWNKYLVKIIAANIEITAWNDSAVKFTAAGMVKTQTDTVVPASLTDISHKTQNLKSYVDMIISNLEAYLKRNPLLYPCANACKKSLQIMEPQRYDNDSFFGIQLL